MQPAALLPSQAPAAGAGAAPSAAGAAPVAPAASAALENAADKSFTTVFQQKQ